MKEKKINMVSDSNAIRMSLLNGNIRILLLNSDIRNNQILTMAAWSPILSRQEAL